MHEKTNYADAQWLSETTAQAMYARDRASQALGMKIEQMRPGYARVTMTVRRDMLNGQNSCHGGFIFALADSSFAFACNSYNHLTVAAGCTIDYLVPAHEGDLLTAEAIEQFRAVRTGLYDVTVTNQKGQRVALFRGKSHRITGEVLTGVAEAQVEETRGNHGSTRP